MYLVYDLIYFPLPGKSNGADGPAQWVYRSARDKMIA